jgi:hypothetical protein
MSALKYDYLLLRMREQFREFQVQLQLLPEEQRALAHTPMSATLKQSRKDLQE